MLRIASIILALSLSAATAFAGGLIYNVYIHPSYRPNDIAYAGGPGELWTEVIGNPFGAPQPDFDRAVTSAMYGAHFGPATKFTTLPGPAARRAFHVRLMFNPPAMTNSTHICTANPLFGPSVGAGAVRLSAAFCQDGEALTFLQADGGRFSGPSDPRFRGFIRDVTMQLFPTQNNPELLRGNNSRCRFSNC
jgi:hypothetical protein